MQEQVFAEHLGVNARQQLDMLRRGLDERLARLEAALSGARSDVSLEALILDLARVATDEAQAAADLASVDARRELDAARQRLAAFESSYLAERQRIEQQHELAIAAERATAGELERSVQELQRRFDGQSSAVTLANQARVRADERIAALTEESASAAAQCKELTAEIARVRAVAAEHERAYAELQQRFESWQAERDAERAAAAVEKEETQQVLAQVKEVFLKFGQQKTAVEERYRTLEAELTRTRDALARSEARIRSMSR